MLSLSKVSVIISRASLRRAALMLIACVLSMSMWLQPTAHATEATQTDDLVLLQQLQQQGHATQLGQASNTSQNNTAAAQSSSTEPTRSRDSAQATADTGSADPIVALPTINAAIVDQANILSAAEKQSLAQQIDQIYRQGKAQIGIVIVPTTGQESIADFALRLAEKVKYGSAGQDNGLLIAVAANDRRIHIASGYGLEGVLPDIVLGRIIRNQITPAFREGQYGLGIQQGVNEIERILNMDPEVAQKAAQDLAQRQHDAMQKEQAQGQIFNTAIVIFLIGAFASMFIGKRISAATAGVTGFAAGLIYGSGVIYSLFIGFGLFFMLVTPLAQLILQALMSGGGRGGGGGGRGGGGGFSGGGGRFGGGGASGSW